MKKTQKKALARATELSDLDLQRVDGGSRVRIPIGYTDTGEPIYSDDDP